jgi:hypothetical protein
MADQASTQRRRRRATVLKIAGVTLIALLLLAGVATTVFVMRNISCLSSGGEYEAAEAPSPAPAAMDAMPGAPGMMASVPGGAPGGRGGPGGPTATGTPLFSSVAAAAESREIIYTASMTVEVDDVGESARSVEELIKSSSGWLGSKTSRTDHQGNTSTTISMRVPAAKFDSVMDALRALGDVRSENINAEDVTKQVTDLEARLRNLRREEGVIADLFQRQGRIADVLEVERELSRVRGEIEQGQSTLAGLRESVRYSTITVTINTRPSKLEQKLREWSAGYHVLNAWNALIKVVRALITALIYLAIVVGPFVLLGLVIWAAVRASRRRKASGPEA